MAKLPAARVRIISIYRMHASMSTCCFAVTFHSPSDVNVPSEVADPIASPQADLDGPPAEHTSAGITFLRSEFSRWKDTY